MNNPFTVEESNLIAVYSTTNRQMALDGLYHSLPYQMDGDLVHLTHRTIDKLDRMSDEDFNNLEITPALPI